MHFDLLLCFPSTALKILWLVVNIRCWWIPSTVITESVTECEGNPVVTHGRQKQTQTHLWVCSPCTAVPCWLHWLKSHFIYLVSAEMSHANTVLEYFASSSWTYKVKCVTNCRFTIIRTSTVVLLFVLFFAFLGYLISFLFFWRLFLGGEGEGEGMDLIAWPGNQIPLITYLSLSSYKRL